MKIQRLYSYVRQALDGYKMIDDGDKIAIGISGGKDSLTLLYALSGIRRFYPKKFQIIALTVDLGYDDSDFSEIDALCKKLDVEYYVVKTDINKMLENGQCSLCARLRKGALNNEALRLGCNKIAYAHNMDDVVETMMLSMIYEGRFSSFQPVTHLEKTKLEVIRPLVYTPVSQIIGFKNKYDLPITKNPCPFEKQTQRNYVRELLAEINEHAPGVKERMMTAVRDGIKEWNKMQ